MVTVRDMATAEAPTQGKCHERTRPEHSERLRLIPQLLNDDSAGHAE
jgi:hypothetical protein